MEPVQPAPVAWYAAIPLGLVLALGCGSLPLAGQTGVAVRGTQDWTPPERLVLEIGSDAWQVGMGGVVSLDAFGQSTVRVVGAESCQIYASFIAPAGTMWVVRFRDDGTTGVEQRQDMNAGPAIPRTDPSGCP
jgi:hypothetical protein